MKPKTLTYLFMILVVVNGLARGQGPPRAETRGLRLNCNGASPGYTLFAPMSSKTTYLMDLAGQVVRTWTSAFEPSAWVYLLDNGHLLRGGNDPGSSPFRSGGQGGRFQEFDLDGNLVWDFRFNDGRLPHHDVAVLPNGNILAIVWESKTAAETRQAGRREGFIPQNGIWPDMLIEFEPLRPNGARIVWEWHIWDHLIQNVNPARDNYGDLVSYPERIDLNGDTVGDSSGNFTRDVFHTNAVAYDPDLDQIILSVPTFNEIWVIDHSATVQEAAGHTGGRSGKGGDLLYRWGNPQVYGRGTEGDRLLGFQHNAHWIPQGLPGAGHMMAFSNMTPSPAGTYSKVYEFVPPVDAEGRYPISASGPFLPAEPLWTYAKPDSLQAANMSGAERLENGNTLISSGPQGRVFEVTPLGDVVWEYWSPYSDAFGGGINSAAFGLFRAIRIGPGHPALRGRDLRPLTPQPPVNPFAGTIPGTGTSQEGCPTAIFPAPTLTGIHPSSGTQGTNVEVAFTGTNFISPRVVVSGEGVTVGNVKITSTESLTANITVASGAPLGIRDVALTAAGGTSPPMTFTVLAPQPTLTGIVPGVGARGAGEFLDVMLTGSNFAAGLTLEAGDNIAVSDIHVIGSTKATARFSVGAAAALGPRDVKITTSGGTSGAVAFTIANPFPDLSITSTHAGNFGVGFSETYSVAVRNVGTTPTTGPSHVRDTLPAGFAFLSAAGIGWSCSASGKIVTCTNSSALGVGESASYVLTLDVGSGAAGSVDHAVSVLVEGDLNTANDSASDPTIVVTASPAFVFAPARLAAEQQATVTITMANPFPHEVTGSMTLSFASNAAIPLDDPAIQFATGGRIVTFSIPANGTEARFGLATQPGPIGFQTGTVAGTFSFAGTFRAGRIQGSFSPPVGARDSTIPHTLSIQNIQTSNERGFAASILLFATSREVTQVTMTFHTNAKVRLSCGTTASCSVSGNTLTLDVQSSFTQWFNSDTTFGGLTLLRLPLSIEGGAVQGTVAISLRNNQGVSNSASFALP